MNGRIAQVLAALLIALLNVLWGGFCALALATGLACMDVSAEEAATESREAGQPMRIEVFPGVVKLTGPRSRMQLVVTGHFADGSVRDLTRASQFASTRSECVGVENGVVLSRQDGRAEIAVIAGRQAAVVPVEVAGFGHEQAVSFEYETLAAISKQGCNSGACHGSPSGKGGFRLSLRAFDPVLDRLTLIREDLGRRINLLSSEESLLLRKPLMQLPHGGGKKLSRHDAAYTILRKWIEEGARPDAENAARCVRIEVYPAGGRVLGHPAWTQQIAVLAHFSDGSTRDITNLACYDSSDDQIAAVSPAGLVQGKVRGEAAIIVRYLEHIESTPLTFVQGMPGYVWSRPPAANYVDVQVHEKLKQLQYLPAGLCSDEEFVRRVSLDVTGLLPTPEEANAFVMNGAGDKRARLIDSLLARPEHARFWSLKWGDLLRVTSRQMGSDGVFRFHGWLVRAFEENMPYDEFARTLVTAQGSTSEFPPANFYRAAADTQDSVESVAQIFLGSRLQCAKCHNHPFERWTQDNYYGMAAFFHRVQRKKSPSGDEMLIHLADSGEVKQPRTGKTMKPWLPGKRDADVAEMPDRRTAFASWLTASDNTMFAQVEANRLWSFVMGRGIVEPPDDFRDSNPPSNRGLLEALAADFVEHDFDRRHLLQTILNSRTYQADHRAGEFTQEASKYFSHYQPRLLSAEQLLDALSAATDVPESFAGLPAGTKATALPAPDVAKHDFLRILGQPERQSVCSCERANDSNLGLAIQLFNGPVLYGKLRDERNRFRRMLVAGRSHADIIAELYLSAVCRQPSAEELSAGLKHIAAQGDSTAALEDIAWAILNTNEFLFQH